MDKKNFTIVAVVCVGILILLGMWIYHNATSPVDTFEYGMQVYVGDKIGFNLDKDKIWFGIVPPGMSGTRAVGMNNTHPYPVEVKVSATGDLAKWVGVTNVTSNPFTLNPGEAQSVVIVVTIPVDVPADFSGYDGKLTIRSYRIFDLF